MAQMVKGSWCLAKHKNKNKTKIMNMFCDIEERRGRGWNHAANMSNNASHAYDEGQSPISKWTRPKLVAKLEENEIGEEVISALRGCPLWFLKELFLNQAEKHHVGKRFKPVMFYWVNVDRMNEIEDLKKYIHWRLLEVNCQPFSRICVDEKSQKWLNRIFDENKVKEFLEEAQKHKEHLESWGSFALKLRKKLGLIKKEKV